MNRMKTILMMGAAVLMALPAAAENGPVQAQKPIRNATQDNKAEALELAAPGKQDDVKSQLAKLKADLADTQKKLDHLSSAGGDQKDGGGTTNSIPEIPNSDANYLDDHLDWNMPIHVYQTGSSGGPDSSKEYCLKAGTAVVGLSSSFTSVTPTGSKTATNYLPVRLDTHGTLGVDAVTAPVQAPAQATGSGDSGAAMCDKVESAEAGDNTLTLNDDTKFYISQNDLEGAADRVGWDYGTLVVPFKFQMSDKSIVTGSASLGGYLGYSFPLHLPGFRLRPIGFVGVSEISVPNSDGGKGKNPTSTIAGLSYGVGLMGTIKDKFNISLVFGADHVSGSNYQYQDKPWVSFALGYSFTK